MTIAKPSIDMEKFMLFIVFYLVTIRTSEVYSRLTTCYVGSVCPETQQSFTCEVAGNEVVWVVRRGRMNLVLVTLIPSTDLSQPVEQNGITFTFTFSFNPSTGNSTSTLSTVIGTTLDRAVVECRDSSSLVDSVTIEVANLPSPPNSISSTGQTNSINAVDVTIGWNPPTNNGGADIDNYTVSISPPTTQLSATVVTSTTVTVTVDYNEDYTINIVAANCAGNSTAVEYMFRIAGCPPLSAPSNGGLEMYTDRTVGATVTLQCDVGFMSTGPMTATCMTDMTWSPDPGTFVCSLPTTQPPAPTTPPILCPPLQPPSNGRLVDYTSNTNSPVSTTVIFQCDDGLFPRDVMTTTCGASGQWDRNPADLVCRERPVNCTLPAEPRNGTILGYGNFNGTVIEGTMLTFQCDPGFLLNGEMTITCTNAGEWSNDPDGLECTVTTPVAPLSNGAAVGVSVVVTFIVAVFIGFLTGLLVMYMIMRKKATFDPSVVSTNPPQEQPPPPGPVYEEVSTPKENIELETNLAYGPLRH